MRSLPSLHMTAVAGRLCRIAVLGTFGLLAGTTPGQLAAQDATDGISAAVVEAMGAQHVAQTDPQDDEAGWRDVAPDSGDDWSVVEDPAGPGDAGADDGLSQDVTDLFDTADVPGLEGFVASPPPKAQARSRAFRAERAPTELPQQVLIELFSSQGCSACPPADAMLADLAQRKDVLPVALHVDYWDYLGWDDSFARPQFTARQEAYARRDGSHAVYTPQFVIGGRTSPETPRPSSVLEGIRSQPPAVVSFSQISAAPRHALRLSVAGKLPRPASVGILTYRPEASVAITAGENRGRTVSYVNILRGWTEVARWDGQAPLRVSLTTAAFAEPGERLAIVVQDLLPGPGGTMLPGQVLGAAILPE